MRTFGNTGRNIISGPGRIGTDVSLHRVFPIGERFRFELRGEAFNLTNTPQFGNPAASVTGANFGEVRSASGERVQPFAGPLAILVDAMSGSASECFAGGMQSIGRARVFGQTSMGQALPALFDRLPNGDVLIHAYGDFVTATGMRLEGKGVIPDEEVPLDRADLLAGRDRTMDAALAWIARSRSPKTPQHP